MKTILVLDDESSIRSLLGTALSSILDGCRVLDAPDGLEGISILEKTPIDLIVTDLRMPRLDGVGFIEQAKRICPAVPVYVMSGYCDQADRERLTRLGVSRFFDKPFSFETMAESAASDLGLPRFRDPAANRAVGIPDIPFAGKTQVSGKPPLSRERI